MKGTIQEQRDIAQISLNRYLLSHEDDIFNGINDFGDLRALFFFVTGYPAKADKPTT